jgi:hypothetical protein
VQDVVSNTQRLERISQSDAILKYKADKKAKQKEAKRNQSKATSDQEYDSEVMEPIVIESDIDYDY